MQRVRARWHMRKFSAIAAAQKLYRSACMCCCSFSLLSCSFISFIFHDRDVFFDNMRFLWPQPQHARCIKLTMTNTLASHRSFSLRFTLRSAWAAHLQIESKIMLQLITFFYAFSSFVMAVLFCNRLNLLDFFSCLAVQFLIYFLAFFLVLIASTCVWRKLKCCTYASAREIIISWVLEWVLWWNLLVFYESTNCAIFLFRTK